MCAHACDVASCGWHAFFIGLSLVGIIFMLQHTPANQFVKCHMCYSSMLAFLLVGSHCVGTCAFSCTSAVRWLRCCRLWLELSSSFTDVILTASAQTVLSHEAWACCCFITTLCLTSAIFFMQTCTCDVASCGWHAFFICRSVVVGIFFMLQHWRSIVIAREATHSFKAFRYHFMGCQCHCRFCDIAVSDPQQQLHMLQNVVVCCCTLCSCVCNMCALGAAHEIMCLNI